MNGTEKGIKSARRRFVGGNVRVVGERGQRAFREVSFGASSVRCGAG